MISRPSIAYAVVSVILLVGCSALVPAATPVPGRDVILRVVNASDNQVGITMASGNASASTDGDSMIEPCMSTLITFGGVHERLTVAVDGDTVVDGRVPNRTGHLVVALTINSDGEAAGELVVQDDPPVEFPTPDCG